MTMKDRRADRGFLLLSCFLLFSDNENCKYKTKIKFINGFVLFQKRVLNTI